MTLYTQLKAEIGNYVLSIHVLHTPYFLYLYMQNKVILFTRKLHWLGKSNSSYLSYLDKPFPLQGFLGVG